MKCPACSHEISDAIEVCAVCGFSLDELDAKAEGLPCERPEQDVHDPQGCLSRSGAARIQERIDAFEAATGGELRVVILPSVQPLSASEASFWLFNRWDLGGEENRGVLLLVATRDRRVQCEVGYGFESRLSDAEAGRILDFHVVPLLGRGAIDEALVLGVRLIAELIETAGATAAARPVANPGEPVQEETP